MGIIEKKLIEKGFDVHLQECTDEVVPYLEKQIGKDKLNFISDKNLTNIESAKYDFILVFGVYYSIPPAGLSNFMDALSRIVKRGGIVCIAGDGSFAWSLLKSLFFKHEGILWGWRSPWWYTVHTAKRSDLKLLRHDLLGENMKPYDCIKIFGSPIKFVNCMDFFLFNKT